jgi:hypothetical protein
MFGISPIGWVHTLASLPAVPVAAYMFIRHGRIVPRSKPGIAYFIAMLVGSVTIFPIAHMPASNIIALVTMALLFIGYGVGRTTIVGRATKYVEVITLSLTAFLLMLPTVTETLRRVPDGHPIVTDLNSPILKGAQGALLATLLIGVTAQVFYMRRQARAAAASRYNEAEG